MVETGESSRGEQKGTKTAKPGGWNRVGERGVAAGLSGDGGENQRDSECFGDAFVIATKEVAVNLIPQSCLSLP